MKAKMEQRSFSEHPWDTDPGISGKSRGVFLFFMFLLCFVMIYPVSAQGPIPPPVPTEPELDESQQLTRAQKQTAEDYEDVLGRLKFLLDDYIQYFAKFDEVQAQRSQNKLLKVRVDIEKGKYFNDVNALSKDLATLSDYLRSEEKSLRKEDSNYKLYKNIRNLRREIELLEDTVDDEIATRIKKEGEKFEPIKYYLIEKNLADKAQKENYAKLIKLVTEINKDIVMVHLQADSLKIHLNKEYLNELKETAKLQEELVEAYELNIHDDILKNLENIQIPPNIPAPPTPPTITPSDGNSHVYVYDTGKAKDKKVVVDSLFVSSPKIPIFIDNRTGSLIVDGWDKDKIFATYKVEVQSDSKSETTDIINKIELKLINSTDGIYISASFPQFKDASSQIVDSKMILNIPWKNPVTCENSFGQTEIVDLANNLSLSTKMSKTKVANVKGNIQAVNSLGSNQFVNVTGTINLISTKGEVSLKKCEGTFKIVNSYAPVNLSGCTGSTSIKNSGDITILDHTGDIEIDNKNGLIKVGNIDGNIELKNSYQPLFVNAVTGTAKLENKNALIDITDVSGYTSAVNRRGTISAKSLTGPIHLTNQSGDILFNFNGTLADNSVIQADYSVVNLVVSKNSNILVDASTEGGTITSSYNTKIKQDDSFVSSTVLSLGKPSHKLKVNGTNATIIISGEK